MVKVPYPTLPYCTLPSRVSWVTFPSWQCDLFLLQDPSTKVQQFMEANPIISEFDLQLRSYAVRLNIFISVAFIAMKVTIVHSLCIDVAHSCGISYLSILCPGWL